jgi:hypothetical protein
MFKKKLLKTCVIPVQHSLVRPRGSGHARHEIHPHLVDCASRSQRFHVHKHAHPGLVLRNFWFTFFFFGIRPKLYPIQFVGDFAKKKEYYRRYKNMQLAMKTLHWNETDGIWFGFPLSYLI